MNKTQHYVTGQWLEGQGEGAPVYDSITGEQFTSTTVEGLDVPSILQYGRDNGSALRKMTFQLCTCQHLPATITTRFSNLVKTVNIYSCL